MSGEDGGSDPDQVRGHGDTRDCKALAKPGAWGSGARPPALCPVQLCFKRPHSFQVLCVGRQGNVPCITE